MNNVPPEITALVRKADRIAGEQRVCFHDWEFVEGTIVHKELHRLYDNWPNHGTVIAEYVTEHGPVGHYHCTICNMRTATHPRKQIT